MTYPEGRFFNSSGYLPPMTTYAQNFEDVTLRRALQDIENGFYVDVGAWHPTRDSVTRWFYDQGWHGINVEPNSTFLDMLRRERPRDINVSCAVGGSDRASATLHVVSDTGLSTLDRSLLQGVDRSVTGEITISVVTLDRLFAAHEPLPTIDFLKIDAEGSEAEIVQAASFTRHRPRIVLIEATGYNVYGPILEGRGYRFVWFDGLNAFYVREEDMWRAALLARPPNLWDNATSLVVKELSAELARRRLPYAARSSAALRARLLSISRRLASRYRRVVSAAHRPDPAATE